MGGDGSFTRQAITDTNETLSIDYEKDAAFYIKELDELQNNVPVRNAHARDCMMALFNEVDGDVLGEYDQATSDVDDGDLGGTSGNGITVSANNISKIFINALKMIQRQNILISNNDQFTGVPKEDRIKRYGVAVISPDFYSKLLERLDGKDSMLGDKVGVNGHAGRYMGFELFVSNSLAWTATLLMGTNPTPNDTIVINGVTWTYVAALSGGSATGEILIGAAAANTADNTVAAINGASGDTTTYEEVSASDRLLLNNITATDGTTQVTFEGLGTGYVVVSETLTAAADVWTTTAQIEHQIFGVNQAIDVVIQKRPNKKAVPRSGYVGNDVVTWTAYGIKTFNEGAPMLVDVNVRSDGY